MTVVLDHDTRHVVWMADGHGKDVLRSFFDALGEERARRLQTARKPSTRERRLNRTRGSHWRARCREAGTAPRL